MSASHCKKCSQPLETSDRPVRTASLSSLVWRDEDKLVVDIRAMLPDRCVICNADAEGRRFPLTLSYNHKLLKAPMMAGVAAIKYDEVELPVALCAAHLARKRHAILAGIGMIVAGLAVALWSIFSDLTSTSLFVMFGGMFSGFIVSSLGALLLSDNPIVIETADETRFWIKGACAEYLSTLPSWHGQG